MKVIYFDGECVLCNKSMQWIIRRDRNKIFHFATMNQLPDSLGVPHTVDSVVFMDENRYYTASEAVIRIANYLPGFKWTIMLRWIPAFLRNSLYRWVARNRYRWFGKQTNCLLADDELKPRILGTSSKH